MAGEEESDQVVFEVPHLFRYYKSGRVDRFIGTDVVPAGVDPATGVASKDVTIVSPDVVTARLFLPKIADPGKRLPVLVHFHGGVFVIQTPFSASSHNFLNSLAAAAGAIVVSVHYRRAPESPLPAAFDDSWAAFRWVASHGGGSGPEPWLAEHGDFGRVFVGGESAGATISHYVARRAGREGATPAIAGAVLVHPYFWGTHEMAPKDVSPQQSGFMEKFWKFLCPGTSGGDDPLINPLAGWPAAMAEVGAGRVLVCVAEKDRMRSWGVAYYEGLRSSGWKGTAEMFESEGEEHVFHLLKAESDKSRELKNKIVDFINQTE